MSGPGNTSGSTGSPGTSNEGTLVARLNLAISTLTAIGIALGFLTVLPDYRKTKAEIEKTRLDADKLRRESRASQPQFTVQYYDINDELDDIEKIETDKVQAGFQAWKAPTYNLKFAPSPFAEKTPNHQHGWN